MGPVRSHVDATPKAVDKIRDSRLISERSNVHFYSTIPGSFPMETISAIAESSAGEWAAILSLVFGGCCS